MLIKCSNCGKMTYSSDKNCLYCKSELYAGVRSAGIIHGNVSSASKIYGEDRFCAPRGNGFAAERANHLYDKLTGHDAAIVGDDNARYGADRMVDGIQIQSKYCSSGSKCIADCFKDGHMKYINPDGTPMQIEVPSDMYDSAVQAMESRISRGEVPGVSDPKDAAKIVRKGHFTYKQAVNIARAGTVESITYDAVNGGIIAGYSFGITAALTFALSVWHGDDIKVSLKNSALSGIKVGGSTFAVSVLSSQLSKAGLNSLLTGSSEAVVSIIGPKASAVLVNALRSGTNIYGSAAMKSAAKLLRGNAITGTVSVVVLSSFDVVNIFRGRISGKQLFKNIANTSAGVVGGSVGWTAGAAAGAAIGTAVFPGAGSAVGGVIGGIAGALGGGALSVKGSSTVLDKFIEDDAVKMVKIIETVFIKLVNDYLLNHEETEHVAEKLQNILSGKKLKDMFASHDRNKFAEDLLIPLIEDEIKRRKQIILPNVSEMIQGLRLALENM